MSERVAVLCPGRGSYTAASLGSLADLEEETRLEELRARVARADRERAERGLPGIRELDGAERFGSRFLRADNAAPLTLAVGLRDWMLLRPERARPVVIGGNSMGWYTALHCAGVLSLEGVWTLVETMAAATGDAAGGGQVIYPLVDSRWRADPDARERVEEVVRQAGSEGHAVGSSIRFGGYAVLWADDDGVRFLLEHLPACQLGDRDYPMHLLGNAAFHSPLMAVASARGLEALGGLDWRAPALPLVDGRGVQWRPLSADPEDVLQYTLGAQVVETFDFAACVRVILREYAPDRLVLLGPGESLGAAVGQVLVGEGWRGIDSREAFVEQQRVDPFVVSLARPEQRALVCG